MLRISRNDNGEQILLDLSLRVSVTSEAIYEYKISAQYFAKFQNFTQ
ncbi:hypothetical protein OFN95_07440 [Campylobacter sp. VBCF_02 NA5]|nr:MULTISPECIES: hypothetical protein [unclassified Campylobacter]MDA3055136.1 hypothetical protein [Campylobacter sp. VBCF_07 NA4]MDA3061387.1 hypothetical protein [Campylobacter sp. VBCF_02 NA5]WBR54045.1 hypothetical protein PF027_06915 [Campylobacter sp. VBCF_01 NA2]